MNLSHTRCDICGRSMEKAHRVENGEAYCHTCYKRDFGVVACSQCRKPTRVLKHIGHGVCDLCSRKARHCVRCSGPVLRAALIVSEGAVCKKCRRYFEPKPRKVLVFGHATCHGCHKYRRVALRDEKQRPLCKACLDPSHIEKAREKDRAYWARRVQKHADLLAHGLETEAWQELFKSLVTTLGATANPPVVMRRAARYLEIYQALESISPDPRALSAAAILSRFTAVDLRQAEKALSYLHINGIDTPTREKAAEASEHRRIEQIIAEVKGSPHEQRVRDFASQQLSKGSKDQTRRVRSVRLNVRAAVAFLQSLGQRSISNRGIQSFLDHHPGHRACLYAFVSFLRSDFPTLSVPIAKRPRTEPPTVDHTATALERFRSARTFTQARAGFVAVLLAVLGLPIEEACTMPWAHLTQPRPDSFALSVRGHVVDLPPSLSGAVLNYIELRSAHLGKMSSSHLFPGRPVHHPVTAATIPSTLRQWGISATASGAHARRRVIAAATSR